MRTVIRATAAAFVLGAFALAGRGDEARPGWELPDPDAPYPTVLGASVDPWGHGYWPVRARRLERAAWRSSQGAEVGDALPAADGRLRVLGGGGGLRSIDPATGDVRSVADGDARLFNYSSAAVGPDGVAYYGNAHFLSAASPAGKILWRTELGASWLHAPPAVSPDGSTVYVGGDFLGIAALDAATGAVRWLRRDFRSAGTSYAFDPDGRVIASFGPRIVCFDRDGKEIWQTKGRLDGLMLVNGLLVGASGNQVNAIGLADRKTRWKADLGAAVRGIALGDDGRVRASLADGAFAAIDLTGAVAWRVRVSDVALAAPATCAGGDAVVGDANGALRIIDLDGETVSCFETGVGALRGRPTVLRDGRVVVHGANDLVCVMGAERPLPPRPRATRICVVADDFVVDVWQNGKLVPLAKRRLIGERHGATNEVVSIDVHDGDWLVFHVVANRLRWNGASYFGACALDPLRRVAFSSTTSGNWSACDDPGEAPRFIAERGFGADRLAVAPAHPWADAKAAWREMLGGDFPGEPVWGTSASTWVKCIVPPAKSGD